MLMRQIINEDLACASYILADGSDAAVVDPQWEVEPYLRIAAEHDLRITHIFETHNHADHVSGHGRLSAATGASVHISADADVAYDHAPVSDGDRYELGDVVIRALATPGHRPEHMSYLIEDRSRAESPWVVLTGDSAFVNDVARPDLAVDPEEGARGLFGSLRRLRELPDETELWPAHIGGSLCGGGAMSEKPSSTIGFERALNPFWGILDEDDFVSELTAGSAPQPPNFERIVELNRGPLITERAPLEPLTPARLSELLDSGTVLMDGREPHEFDAAHVPGAINVTRVKNGVGTRAAWAADADADIAILGATDEDARELQGTLEAVGFHSLRGYLAGGIGAWRQAGEELRSTPAVDAEGLAERLREGSVVLVDVREDDEWEAGHVEGSIHVPYRRLRDGVPEELAGQRKPLAVACSAGVRSALASSLLERTELTGIEHVARGGVPQLAEHGIDLQPG